MIFLYPIFFAIWFILIKEKKKHIIYAGFVFAFLLSSVCSTYLVYNDEEYQRNIIDLVAIMYHLVAFFLLFYPLRLFDERRNIPFQPSKENVLFPFTIFIIVIMITYFVNSITSVSVSSIIEDAANVRYETTSEGGYSNFAQNSLLAYVDIFARYYSFMPLALTFYYIKFSPGKKVLILVLLFCSIVNPIISLKVASRDVIIRYVVVFAICYYYFRGNIKKEWTNNLKTFFVVFGSFAVAMFLVISISRFEDRTDNGTLVSFVQYFGQGFANFSKFFVDFPDGLRPDNHGAVRFPIFAEQAVSSLNTNDTVAANYYLNVFSTSVGSFVGDCGWLIGIIVVITVSFLFTYIGKMKSNNVFTLFYALSIFEFAYMSIFYYSGRVDRYYVVLMLVLIVLDKMSRKPVRK